MSEPFLAEIRIFAGNFAPRGWAFCNGQLLPISQNSALFSLLGTTYGGDGRTTTALPNLMGRAPMHPGRGPGLTTRRLGQKIGISQVTLHEIQLPAHTHTMRAASTSGSEQAPSPLSVLGSTLPFSPQYQSNTTANLAPLSSAALGNSGGSQPHGNKQPYLALNYIIALQGLYPSRS